MTTKSKTVTKLSLLAALAILSFFVAFFFRGGTSANTPALTTLKARESAVPEKTVMYFENGSVFKGVTNIDLLSFSPRFSSINSRTYYSKLGENEKLVYSAYEYAFENCLEAFYLNGEILSACAYNDVELLIFLSLDHPLVEQNFEITTSAAKKEEADFNSSGYTYFEIPAFSRELFEKKLQALGAAQAVVGTIPEDTSEADTAYYLYKKLCDFCEYKGYSGVEEPICYVYDALVTGVSHCDGFANAYSLLLNLANIPAAEKARYDEPAVKTVVEALGDGEASSEYYKTPTGHTWVTFEIDGDWYDADPSYDSKDRLVSRSVQNLYLAFGLPKSFSTDYSSFDYSYLVPECCDSFLRKPACEFKTVDDEGIEKELYRALSASTEGYVFLTFETAEMEDLGRLAKRVCEYADISIYYGRCPSTPVLVYFAFREKD